jgi:transposase
VAVDDANGLFGALPEHVAPGARQGGRPRLRLAERGQVELRALSLDALVAPEHRVRLVWAFAERLDLAPLYGAIRSVEGGPGHPPADPRVLTALWLYATIEGVGSARKLARLCEEHVAYQWLCGGVSVNHKTLADFRVGHGALLERLLVDGFAALMAAGVARLERVAQDGMRVRASAGAASFRRRSTLEKLRAEAAAEVARLAHELEADPGAADRRERAARVRAAADREARVTAALLAAETLEAARAARDGKRDRGRPGGGGAPDGGATADAKTADAKTVGAKAGREPEVRASTTDPQARVMKMADGGWRPAYNAQIASDTGTGLVVGVAVETTGSDMGQLREMSDALEAAYGLRPREHLVDGGFAKLADIDALAAEGVAVYTPPPTPRSGRDPHAALPGDPPAIAGWRCRMGTDDAKAVYKQRAATAELVNAQARNRGLVRLLVRGAEKVKAVLLWHALAHNMARLWSLAPA